jgi:hypothetical protein
MGAARFEAQLALSADASELSSAVRRIADEVEGHEPGWIAESRNTTRLSYRVPISFRSWGERISIVLDGDELRITSTCRFPLQVFDWGKNQQNVQRQRSIIRRKVAGLVESFGPA